MANTAYLTGNYLMHPTAPAKAVTINGRTYNTPVGTPISVPDFDAHVLEANGWVAAGTTSTTAARPVQPPVGTKHMDSTLSAAIFFDGVVWRNQFTGAVV